MEPVGIFVVLLIATCLYFALRNPARRVRIVFRCKTCDATFPCEFENFTADEIVSINPAGIAVAGGWQREPSGMWSCTAHAREA